MDILLSDEPNLGTWTVSANYLIVSFSPPTVCGIKRAYLVELFADAVTQDINACELHFNLCTC